MKQVLYQRAHEIILFWDAKLFHSGSNSGTPWHLKKGLSHALVGISYGQQFPITFKLSGPAPNLGVRHGSVVAGASWGHSNTIQAAAWLVKLR